MENSNRTSVRINSEERILALEKKYKKQNDIIQYLQEQISPSEISKIYLEKQETLHFNSKNKNGIFIVETSSEFDRNCKTFKIFATILLII